LRSRHCTRTYVAAHEGFCKLALGRHDEAVALLEAVLMDWPQSYRQDEAVARSWLAHAYAEAGRLAEAGLEGTRALALTIQTGSARAQRDLGRLEARLVLQRCFEIPGLLSSVVAVAGLGLSSPSVVRPGEP